MALISCPECGKEISDKVKACPYCGYPLEVETIEINEEQIKLKKAKKRKMILIIGVTIVFITILVSLCIFVPKIQLESKYEQAISYIKDEDYNNADIFLNNVKGKNEGYKDVETLLIYNSGLQTYQICEDENKADTVLQIVSEIPDEYSGEFSQDISAYKAQLKIESDEYIEMKIQEAEKQRIIEKQRARTERINLEFATSKQFYLEIEECPLEITEQIIQQNAIDNPTVSISTKNNSEKTIDAYTVYFFMYDNFNNPVNHYLYDTNEYKGISQEIIKPNGTTNAYSYNWTPFGFENTTKFIPYITEIHFSDNTTWAMSDASIEYAKTYSDMTIVGITFE